MHLDRRGPALGEALGAAEPLGPALGDDRPELSVAGFGTRGDALGPALGEASRCSVPS
jgi:hypothetical protein